MPLATVDDALAWLRSVGAPPRLVQHHALVAEAAAELVDGLGACGYAFDAQLVLLGAALHDAGKLQHPDEMNGPGHQHEPAGHELLRTHGLEWIARFCLSHADWDHDDVPLEDLLVALADKLWKGKRVTALEHRVVSRLAASRDEEPWTTYVAADPVFERIAAQGDERLGRS